LKCHVFKYDLIGLNVWDALAETDRKSYFNARGENLHFPPIKDARSCAIYARAVRGILKRVAWSCHLWARPCQPPCARKCWFFTFKWYFKYTNGSQTRKPNVFMYNWTYRGCLNIGVDKDWIWFWNKLKMRQTLSFCES